MSRPPNWRTLAPGEIERESLARIDRLLGAGPEENPATRALTRRLVYASGDLGMADLVRHSPGALEAGVAALRAGATIVCDVRMLASGVSVAASQRLGCAMECAVAQPGATERARAEGITRTAAGLLLLEPSLRGAVVAIGNAPTALLALLELIGLGRAAPALVVGTPVGFVAAAESKELLRHSVVPYVTVVGTRGGSALAAATINLLLDWASGDGAPA